jgi:hypothetical protein
MANQTLASALPVLTKDGITKLIKHLDADRMTVTQSGADPATKQKNQGLIDTVKFGLNQALADSALSGNITSWTTLLAPHFFKLTTRLKQDFPALATKAGACLYQGGCVVATESYCQDLGGVFRPGVDCDGNPLP